MEYFVQVILPLPIRKLFSYRVNSEEARFLQTGMPVAVSFGKAKLYAALVHSIHHQKPDYQEVKDIDSILDERPLITLKQLDLWQWISEYYMCALGEVAKAALPGVFQMESETIIERSSQEIDTAQLTDEEFLIYEALLYKSSLFIKEIVQILGKKNVFPVLHRMLDKLVIKISERIFQKYHPKKTTYFCLHPQWNSQKSVQFVLDAVGNAPKQKDFLLKYFTERVQSRKETLDTKMFLKKHSFSKAIYQGLIQKKIIQEFDIQQDRISFSRENQSIKPLTEKQQKALQDIDNQYLTHSVVLLHGVAASGKTEIYINLIDSVLRQGKQVLYLLPEIGMATQLVERLSVHFSDYLSVYHSQYSSSERAEVWRNLLENRKKARLIVGVRTAVLLPFSDLGLIVVDEEHEKSYKQTQTSPRYNARDVALVLAKIHQARVLLGSSTPSLETYHHAQCGKYGYVKLADRYHLNLFPEITLIDIKDRKRRKVMKGYFSQELLDAISETLQQKEQVILFQNRSGYAPVLECNVCGESPQCPNCDVTLTYHQYSNQLKCHYCGYTMAKPLVCAACGSSDYESKGLGTEQIEYLVKEYFPEARVARMDRETTRGKYGYEKIISQFQNQQIDILVGTQMLVRGLDFGNVHLVGVLNTDLLFNYPEFRASERAFQLLMQAAGRAGRSDRRGQVIMQTYHIGNPTIIEVQQEDYEKMATQQLEERREFRYPPFTRLIKITFKHRNYQVINNASQWFFSGLHGVFSEGIQILGPEFPIISRIRNEYLKTILLKIGEGVSLKKVKNYILRMENSFLSIPEFRSVGLIYDVDTEG